MGPRAWDSDDQVSYDQTGLGDSQPPVERCRKETGRDRQAAESLDKDRQTETQHDDERDCDLHYADGRSEKDRGHILPAKSAERTGQEI